MSSLWDRLDLQLQARAPTIARRLRRPATPEQIGEVEQITGIVFPRDLRDAYLRHDGTEASADRRDRAGVNLFGSYRWMSLAEVVSRWRYTMEDVVGDPEIQVVEAESSMGPVVWNGWWRPGWLPIAQDSANWLLIADMEPGSQGHVGQILMRGMSYCNAVVATGIGSYLGELAELLEQGRIGYDPKECLWRRPDDPIWMSSYGWRDALIVYNY